MSKFWSRRRFLGVAAGAGLGWVAAGRLRGADAPDKFGGFRLGLQSYSLRKFKVDDALEKTRELGLAAIEFFNGHFDFKSDDSAIEAMKSRTAGLGIRIMGHGVNAFTKDHEKNRQYFEFAKKVGIPQISADPTEDAFESLDKLVAEFDIRIAIHNHGPGARYDKVADVLNAVKAHDKRIGACADLGHYIRSAEDPVRVINLLEGRLFGVHLKDFAEQKKQSKGVILGKGHLDVEGVFRALKKVNFPADGCLSLEYEENPDDPMSDLKQCVAVASEGAQQARA